MPEYESVLLLFALLLIGATFVGVLKRGRLRVCRMFLLFLAVVYITDVVPHLWPDRFFTSQFWLVRESVHNALRFAVALELAYFAFRSFPGARSTARALLLLLVTTTLAAVLLSTWELPGLPQYSEILSQLQIGPLLGTVWFLIGVAALILWYRLPIDAMHKAILLGWVPFLLIFAVALKLAGALGWDSNIAWLNHVHTTAYLLLLGFWARAAWLPVGAQVRARAPLPIPASQVG
jgi:hypothetical protein